MNIDKQALRTDMLIVNALETAKQLRELQESPVAESIFESIVENENGKEIQFERPISDLAYAAFLKIESLVEALEAAERSIAELSKAASVNNHWKPDVCPITGRMFFMWIEHETLGYVPTYGGPFDSYTIPTRDSDGEFSCERYDHDFGGWREGECIGLYLTDDDEQCRVHELEQHIAELESKNGNLRTIAHEQNELAIRASLDSNNATVEMGRLHKRIAELEARTVCLPKLPVLGSTSERYEGFAAGASSMRNECANAIHAAGIKVKES